VSNEAILYAQRDSTGIDVCELPAGKLAVCSFPSPDKETPNEDAAAIIPYGDDGLVLVVADGLGGIRAGEVASCTAIQALRDALDAARLDGAGLRTAVINGIETANRAVLDLGIGAATTVVVYGLEDGQGRPFHVGDSVVLVIGQRGKLKLQTVAHSPVGFAVEAGLLDEKEAMHHVDRHIVSNVIGTPEMSLEVGSERKLAVRDTVVLASDGLLDNLHLDEIIERVRMGPLEKAAARLSADALERMRTRTEGRPHKPDDMTFILYRPNAAQKKPPENTPQTG